MPTIDVIPGDITIPLRILQGVAALHTRGHGIRILPGMSPSGMHWRVAIAPADRFTVQDGYLKLRDWDAAVTYTTGAMTEFAGTRVGIATSIEMIADLILARLPDVTMPVVDPEYADWYAGLIRLVDDTNALPIAYTDYFDDEHGWEIGRDSGVRYPHPPQ